ncbi:hypothetical protein BDF19DRAFT_208526 [Syncephalis fuscata]|nr:hypothetical protein BDF19DRAFT_208526 [Syncephalis fuscata]
MDYYRIVLELHSDTLARLQSSHTPADTPIQLFDSNWPDDTDNLPVDSTVLSSSKVADSQLHTIDVRYGPIFVDWFDFSMQSAEQQKDTEGSSTCEITDSTTTVPFILGCTRLEQGVIHLYRGLSSNRERVEDGQHESSTAGGGGSGSNTPLNGSVDDTLVSLLAVPTHMTPADLLAFLGSAIEDIAHIRLLRDVFPHRYIALLKFKQASMATEFIAEYHGRPFSALEPEICQAIRVASVQLVAAVDPSQIDRPSCISLQLDMNVTGSDSHDEITLRELPTCPVCLERMDSRITGLVTIVCQHTFHCQCLSQWGDSRCPVCRYSHLTFKGQSEGEDSGSANDTHSTTSQCAACGNRSNLWICLVCGHIGCGRYAQGHAREHYEQTIHCYALELETQRVWDYAGDGYVHRLIQNKLDGKLVELPDDTGDTIFDSRNPMNNRWTSTSTLPQSKMDIMASEYTHLLTAQLDSQRQHYEVELNAAYEKIVHLQGELEKISPKAAMTDSMYKDIQRLESELTTTQKEKLATDRKSEKLEKRLNTLERLWEEERQVSLTK